MTTEKTEPNSDLSYGAILGDTPWNEWMDENLLQIGRVGFHLSVKSKDVSAPPVGSVDGDRYIVGSAATGDWLGHENNIAVWDNEITAWVIYTPKKGWTAYIEDLGITYTFMSITKPVW